jgi:O-acetyl-ADP-ribose deacetylase (regulator of RNase III)
MIHFVTGNILDSSAQALVNTVNTMGVMGKGIALQFKKQFPNNYRIYKEVCEQNALQVGQLLILEEDSMFSGKKVIINFPTKTNWRLPSEYEYIEAGLKELKKVVLKRNIESIAIPPLGAGNGGLEWQKVKKMIIDTLSDLDCETYLYEPTAAIKEVLNSERVKLTPARAMLLSVLYEMVKARGVCFRICRRKNSLFLTKIWRKK